MNEQLIKNIFENMPLGYASYEFTRDENEIPCNCLFLDINLQFEEYFGLCASDIIGKKVSEVITNVFEDDFDWIKTCAKVAYGGEKIQLEHYVHSLERWFQVYAYSPQKGYFVTLVEDITEKKNSLRQNNEQIKYNNILNKIPVLVCEFTKDSILTYVNDEYCNYFGYERENLIGKLFLDLIPEEEHEAVMKRYLSLTPENPVSVDTHHVLKGNKTCLMEWQNVATFNEHEMIINYYSIGSDVTEREELEKQDKNELAILRSVIENNSAVILFIEPETGKILEANPAASDFYGYTKAELL
ncbi:MAG: PAS domain S-box protein, partial [Sedimentibacter sp.]